MKKQEEKKKQEENKKQVEKKKLEEEMKRKYEKEKKKQEGLRKEVNPDALDPAFTQILRHLNKLQEQFTDIQSEIKAVRTDQRLLLIKLTKLESRGGVLTSSTSSKKVKGKTNEHLPQLLIFRPLRSLQPCC